MSQNNIAVFLDLDNLVIGARQANLTFNIHPILSHIQEITNGRIVLRRAYGDSHQNRELVRELVAAGFVTQVNLSVNNFGKNLADMQITVDAMESLIDERPYHVYVLMTGDQDFSPLAQALRKRDKYVIGIGVRHATSANFASLCDRFLFYEDIVPTISLDDNTIPTLLRKSLAVLEKEMPKVRASVLKQRMDELSRGGFSGSTYAEGGFRKFLERYAHLVEIYQEETTLYVASKRPEKALPPPMPAPPPPPPIAAPAPSVRPPVQPLQPPPYLVYRALLKKHKLRVIPAPIRLLLLKELVQRLQQQPCEWRALIKLMALARATEKTTEGELSKNMVNALLLLARKAGVIHAEPGQPLAQATVRLAIGGQHLFQQALVRCDRTYLQALLPLSESFDFVQASLALYDTPQYAPYLRRLLPEAAANGAQPH